MADVTDLTDTEASCRLCGCFLWFDESFIPGFKNLEFLQGTPMGGQNY